MLIGSDFSNSDSLRNLKNGVFVYNLILVNDSSKHQYLRILIGKNINTIFCVKINLYEINV